jgi:ATP-dependent RNA helicase DeaD
MDIIAALEEAGHDPREIAAAALRLVRELEKQRPIENLSPVRDQPARATRSQYGERRMSKNRRSFRGKRSHEAGMVRLRIDKGRNSGLRPGDVVGILAGTAGIPGHSLGAIRIQQDHTFVDVPEKHLGKVLAQNGRYRLRRTPFTLTKAEE